MGNTSVVQTAGLCYSYARDAKTLVDINLQIERGSVYGFLGPNGSGKTTTLCLLLGLLRKQEGSIEIFGQELHTDRTGALKRVGALIEAPSLYGHLTAEENLAVYRGLYGASEERVGEVLKLTGLCDTGGKTVKKYSLGMKQRLALALALLPKPELLILDEPTNGLDPEGIMELRELMVKLNKEGGITILLSSHILSEVEKMITHVGIIFKGRLLFQGSLSELRLAQQMQSRLRIATSDNGEAIRILQDYEPERMGDGFSVSFHDLRQIAEINKTLVSHNLDVYLLQPREKNLERLYIELTSHRL